MKPLKSITLLLGAGVIAFFISPVFAGEPIPATGPKSDYSDLTGNMPLPEYHDDVPTKATAARMLDQLAYQRAVQMYLWALPAVGMEQYRMAPVANPDGSYDLYFGPEALPGKEKNFVKTVRGKGWFFLFRLYGPEEAYFDGKWKPDDIDKVN